MTPWKWFGSVSGIGFLFCSAMSLLMPSPPNPKASPMRSVEHRIHVPVEAQALLERSCYDCHSNQTRWPSYSRVWPASALIYTDVSMGRRSMNFSEWPSIADAHGARQAEGLLMASCAAVEAHLMPSSQYLLMHPEARVTDEEASRFCAWTAAEVAEIQRSIRH